MSRKPSWMSESGREALPDGLECSGGHLGCTGVFKRPSRMPGNGREALTDVR